MNCSHRQLIVSYQLFFLAPDLSCRLPYVVTCNSLEDVLDCTHGFKDGYVLIMDMGPKECETCGCYYMQPKNPLIISIIDIINKRKENNEK